MSFIAVQNYVMDTNVATLIVCIEWHIEFAIGLPELNDRGQYFLCKHIK